MKLLSEDKCCLNIELLSGELHKAVTWSTFSNLYNYVKLKHCMKLFFVVVRSTVRSWVFVVVAIVVWLLF